MDLTGNHRWICIPWKEKAPQLPEHKRSGIKTNRWKQDKLTLVLLTPGHSNILPIILIIPIYRCPVQFVERPLCSECTVIMQNFHSKLWNLNLIPFNNELDVLSLRSVTIFFRNVTRSRLVLEKCYYVPSNYFPSLSLLLASPPSPPPTPPCQRRLPPPEMRWYWYYGRPCPGKQSAPTPELFIG